MKASPSPLDVRGPAQGRRLSVLGASLLAWLAWALVIGGLVAMEAGTK